MVFAPPVIRPRILRSEPIGARDAALFVECVKRLLHFKTEEVIRQIPEVIALIESGKNAEASSMCSLKLKAIKIDDPKGPDLKAALYMCRARAEEALGHSNLMEADLILASYLRVQDEVLKAEIVCELSHYQIKKRRFQEALDRLLSVVFLRGLPRNLEAQIYYCLGLANIGLEKIAVARKELEAALHLNPDDQSLIKLIEKAQEAVKGEPL